MAGWIDIAGRALFLGLAALFVGLAGYGALVHFDAIPFWDMFDGYLNFYNDFTKGDWGALWTQHNEHRIVLSKLLFLIDLSVLDGTTPFLVLVNLALAGGIAAQFIAFLRHLPDGRALAWVPWFLVIVMFSRLQDENLELAFQSQFFLVYLLPLSALFLAAKSATDQRHTRLYFLASTLCALAALGAMANGILALPALLVFALLTRMSFLRIALLAALSIVSVLVYLQGYAKPPGHSSLMDSLVQYPKEMLAYTLLYLGGAFEATAPIARVKFGIGMSMGLLLIFLLARKARTEFPKGRAAAFQIALIGFAGFVIVTAIMTAGGRVEFGIAQATATRYHTPSLMCWLAIGLLYLPSIAKAGGLKRHLAPLVSLLLVMALVPRQLEALDNIANGTNRMIGALALELEIPDQERIARIYPDATRALITSAQARAVPLSIFALAPIAGAKVQLETARAEAPIADCEASLREELSISNASFLFVTGQLGLASHGAKWTRLAISNSDGTMKGVAIVKAGETNFNGYLQNSPVSDLYIGDESKRCRLQKAK